MFVRKGQALHRISEPENVPMQGRERAGQQLVIAIECNHPVARCRAYAGVARRALSAIDAVLDDAQPRIGKAGNRLHGGIGRTIVDNDRFEVRVLLRKTTGHRARQFALPVERGDHHTEPDHPEAFRLTWA